MCLSEWLDYSLTTHWEAELALPQTGQLSLGKLNWPWLQTGRLTGWLAGHLMFWCIKKIVRCTNNLIPDSLSLQLLWELMWWLLQCKSCALHIGAVVVQLCQSCLEFVQLTKILWLSSPCPGKKVPGILPLVAIKSMTEATRQRSKPVRSRIISIPFPNISQLNFVRWKYTMLGVSWLLTARSPQARLIWDWRPKQIL